MLFKLLNATALILPTLMNFPCLQNPLSFAEVVSEYGTKRDVVQFSMQAALHKDRKMQIARFYKVASLQFKEAILAKDSKDLENAALALCKFKAVKYMGEVIIW